MLITSRSIGGSRIVVSRTAEHYIDVRKDTRRDRCDRAECVRSGHVYRSVPVTKPEQVVELIKEELT